MFHFIGSKITVELSKTVAIRAPRIVLGLKVGCQCHGMVCERKISVFVSRDSKRF